MAKHLRDRDIQRVVELIDVWPDKKFTWEALCEEVEAKFCFKPTRQTLQKHTRIKQAYLGKTKEIKHGVKQNTKTPVSLKVAGQRITRLEAENLRLKRENMALLEQFKVWQYNAYLAGLSEHELNKSLPRVDRRKE